MITKLQQRRKGSVVGFGNRDGWQGRHVQIGDHIAARVLAQDFYVLGVYVIGPVTALQALGVEDRLQLFHRRAQRVALDHIGVRIDDFHIVFARFYI